MKNIRIYLIEAWALGMFMVSACAFTILLEHPASPVRQALPDSFFRQWLSGLAMGITAVLLIYSPWGKRSGAHMNPAVTIANWQMDRIKTGDALGYIIAQFAGGALAVFLFKWLVPGWVGDMSVNYAVTVPGRQGVGVAFFAEMAISFFLFLTVLVCSNLPRVSPYTGIVAGTLVMLYITFEAPLSGMSMNPARTVASAWPAGVWTSSWLYFVAPVIGMVSAGASFRRLYRLRHGECQSMDCYMSGQKHDNVTYEVLR